MKLALVATMQGFAPAPFTSLFSCAAYPASLSVWIGYFVPFIIKLECHEVRAGVAQFYYCLLYSCFSRWFLFRCHVCPFDYGYLART